MSQTTLDFETCDFLVVKDGEKVRFRIRFDSTDMGETEPIDAFISRKGGLEGAILYLRTIIDDETARIMRWPIRQRESSPPPATI